MCIRPMIGEKKGFKPRTLSVPSILLYQLSSTASTQAKRCDIPATDQQQHCESHQLHIDQVDLIFAASAVLLLAADGGPLEVFAAA